MSAVDASIPLSVNSGIDIGKAMSLADVAQKMRIQQSELQRQNALTSLLANPQAYDDKGQFKPETIQAVTSIDPDTGMKLRTNIQEEHLKKVQEKHYETDIGRSKFDFMTGVAGAATDAYDAAIKAGKSTTDATSAARAVRNEAAKNNGGMLGEEDVNQITGAPFDPAQAKVFAGLNKDWSTQRDKVTTEKRQEETEKERERHNLAAEKNVALALQNKQENVNPATQAFKSYMEAHPNATPEEQAQFIQTSKAAPRSAPAMALRKFMDEHPEATADDISKFAGGMKAQSSAMTYWEGSGKGAQQLQSLNTAVNHLDTARGLADALKNGNMQTFNKLAQAWAEETGSPAPTDIESAGQIIGSEFVKAVVAGGGGQAERQKAEQAFALARSPAQLQSAINTVTELMKGQATSARQQFTTNTKLGEDEFYKHFEPRARGILFGDKSKEAKGDKKDEKTEAKGDVSADLLKQYADKHKISEAEARKALTDHGYKVAP